MSTLIQKIKHIPKGYFTLSDIRKITDYSLSSTRVMTARLVERGEIFRLEKGVYCIDRGQVDWNAYACERYAPSYISFETALSFHNVLSQKTLHITLATTKRSKQKTVLDREMLYHHIQKKLYWGYQRIEGFLIASPEKAFLDLLYLSLRGWAICDTEEMNLSFLDKKKTLEYVKRYNIPQMEKRVKQLLHV